MSIEGCEVNEFVSRLFSEYLGGKGKVNRRRYYVYWFGSFGDLCYWDDGVFIVFFLLEGIFLKGE